VTEFSGIGGVGELYGLPRVLTVGCAVVLLLGITLTGTYRSAERVGIALGALELLFIPAALLVHPQGGSVMSGMTTMPLGNHDYMFLLAANVGAVIMPWMLFYQQAATVDKGLRVEDLGAARSETFLGAIASELLMAAVVIAAAAAMAGDTRWVRPL